MSHETRLREQGIELPEAPKALGLYKPVVVVGSMLFTSGCLPFDSRGELVRGRLGDDLSVEAGAQAARLAGLSMLSAIRAEVGSLDRVSRLVKTVGLVRCTSEFTDQPAVINGFSQLMRDVFGEASGVAARSAIGTSALPAGAAVEVEAIFALGD